MSFTKDFEMFENEDFIHFLMLLTIRKSTYYFVFRDLIVEIIGQAST